MNHDEYLIKVIALSLGVIAVIASDNPYEMSDEKLNQDRGGQNDRI